MIKRFKDVSRLITKMKMHLNNLPYLPTEIWDKIYDIKFSLEDKEWKEEHNIKHNIFLESFKLMVIADMEYNLPEDMPFKMRWFILRDLYGWYDED